MKLVIPDTSCFILFTKIDFLNILQETFDDILTTDEVIKEYGTSLSWVTVRNDYDKNTYQKLRKTFGPGESSCIALAQKEDDPLLIIDDKRAKRVAQEIGIECMGSIGVLIVAKRKGVITAIRPIIDEIAKTDFRISERIIRIALELVDE